MANPVPREGSYGQEQSTFGDINTLFRFFSAKKLRRSLSSPPLLKDVPEGEMILDVTLARIYITVDGVLYYIGLTEA